MPSTLTGFYTLTLFAAITHCSAETPFLRKVSRSVRPLRFVRLSVKGIKQLSDFLGAEDHRKVVVFSSIQLAAIAWWTHEMMKWDGK